MIALGEIKLKDLLEVINNNRKGVFVHEKLIYKGREFDRFVTTIEREKGIADDFIVTNIESHESTSIDVKEKT